LHTADVLFALVGTIATKVVLQKYRTGGGARPVCEQTFKSLLKCSLVMRGLREVICSSGIIVRVCARSQTEGFHWLMLNWKAVVLRLT